MTVAMNIAHFDSRHYNNISVEVIPLSVVATLNNCFTDVSVNMIVISFSNKTDIHLKVEYIIKKVFDI